MRIHSLGVLAFVFLPMGSPAALADSVITVSLWDKLSETMMMEDALIQPDGRLDAALLAEAKMGITLDQTTVAAGKITFKASNDSKQMYHEMVVAPLAEGTTALPYLAEEGAVDEAAFAALGEIPDLSPQEKGEVTLEIGPGTYLVYCNLKYHFASGMWTVLTVTP